MEYAPSQEESARIAMIPKEKLAASVWLIEPDGMVSGGAEAVFRSLAYAPTHAWPLWAYRHVPGFAPASEAFYRFVAARRSLFSRLTRIFWGEHLEPPIYFSARWIFLRFLGLIYLAAFVSFWLQIDGLIGKNGILPAEDFLKNVAARLGPERYHLLPTLCWFGCGERALAFLCGGGAALSIFLTLGIAPIPVALLLWAFYLSLSVVGRDFMGFQWDTLLLEAGFLAVFLAPAGFWPKARAEERPSPTSLWLARWLLFRLMFESGAVKLLSGDPTWRNLTALYYHYETQPLPTWIGWHFHQLPAAFQRFSAAAVLAVELAVPWLIWLPRRANIAAFFLLNFLQALIFLTGNYCFFNALAVALSFFLLDDAFLAGAVKLGFPINPTSVGGFRRALIAAFAVLVLVLTASDLSRMFLGRSAAPAVIERFEFLAAPFRSVNRYGLFAVMTTSRREIIVEGSGDGKTWREYPFKWKPGDLWRRPSFVEPHQPRLDWQMWFAALGSIEQNPWFANFLGRLLQGSPEVLALLGPNPFSDAPPRFIRASLYEYHFTGRSARREGAGWWRREYIGPYSPILSFQR